MYTCSKHRCKKQSSVEFQHCVPTLQVSKVIRQLSWSLSLIRGVKIKSVASSCSNARPTDERDLTCCDIGGRLEVHELRTEDDVSQKLDGFSSQLFLFRGVRLFSKVHLFPLVEVLSLSRFLALQMRMPPFRLFTYNFSPHPLLALSLTECQRICYNRVQSNVMKVIAHRGTATFG